MAADGVKTKIDFGNALAVLDGMNGEFKESLARRMLVSGGVLLRDAAKQAAPRSDPPYRPYPGHGTQRSQASGTLANAIYLAQDTDRTMPSTLIAYKISWNNRIAWWGRLVEFGWWQTYEIHRDANGEFYTDIKKPLATPIWHKANSFLGKALASFRSAAIDAMNERGRKEVPILLRELKK